MSLKMICKMIAASLLILCSACDAEYPGNADLSIFISSQTDTAFLHAGYIPEDGIVNENGITRKAKITGQVNTSQLGTYYLDYDFTSSSGKRSATVTKTVHVINNAVSFLNGFYDAVCSCTVLTPHGDPDFTTHTYTAAITSHPRNHHFDLNMFYIGAEYVSHWTSLDGRKINIHFYSPDYDYKSSASGTLVPTRDSILIQSTAFRFYPATTFSCLTILSRRKVIITSAEE